MGKDSRLPFIAAGALSVLAACASLAGLEEPDPRAVTRADPDGGGAAVIGDIVVRPASLTVTSSCGGGEEPPTLTLENQSSASAPYEVQVPEGSAFALRDDSGASVATLKGTLASKQILVVRLRVTSTKTGVFPGQVIVLVAGRASPVPVQVTVNGGELAFLPTLFDFGEVRQQTLAPPQTIEIENKGTEPLQVLSFAPSNDAGVDFTVASPPTSIAPGEKATATATFLAGDAGPEVTAVFEPRTATPTCGELPKLTLKGTRVNQDVTVNPGSVSFGDVDCLSPGGATKTITVSNYANVPAVFDASTPMGSWFTVSPTKATVPAASGGVPGKVDVTVTLNAMGSFIGDHSDPIDIDVTTPQARKTTVPTSVRSVGAKLTIEPVALSGFSNNETKSFSVRNIGNKFLFTRHASSNPNAFAVVNGTNDNALYPGSVFPSSIDVRFVADDEGTYGANITTTRTNSPPLTLYPASGPLCEPPIVVTVKGSR